jgi:hypothetical protein
MEEFKKDLLNDLSNYKKGLTNSLSYIINKKIDIYHNKLEDYFSKNNMIINKLVETIEEYKNINNILIKKLNLKNNYLERIDNIDNNENIIEEIKKNDIIHLDIIDNDDIILKKKEEKDKNIIYKFKDVKVELFNFDDNFVKDCLNYCNYHGDLLLFKKMYIDNVEKEHYPIRHIKKRFQYWLNGSMNDDDKNGTYIRETIIKNIELLYLKVNECDSYSDMDIFLKNQEHINKLSELKYKESFLIKICNFIDI